MTRVWSLAAKCRSRAKPGTDHHHSWCALPSTRDSTRSPQHTSVPTSAHVCTVHSLQFIRCRSFLTDNKRLHYGDFWVFICCQVLKAWNPQAPDRPPRTVEPRVEAQAAWWLGESFLKSFTSVSLSHADGSALAGTSQATFLARTSRRARAHS